MEEEPSAGEESNEATLTFEETRVLGCLMEKAVTTPEYYPLTQSGLASACNQKSNRHPVVEFDDDVVMDGMDGLREKGFGARIAVAGSRVPKYKHSIDQALPALDDRGFALLCVLLLRGQQTVGELRTRTERMFHFASVEDVQSSLDELENYPGRPLVKGFPAGGGRRVPTYVHLLSGDVEGGGAPESPGTVVVEASSRKSEIEEKLAAMQTELDELKNAFAEFRKQFE